jgi:type I restriction enzyme, S subunit
MTEWQTRPIRDLCTHVVDCVNKTAPIAVDPTPFKMLRTTNVRNGWIDTTNLRSVEREVFDRWTRRLRPQRGDVVLTREAPLGEVGMVRTDETVFLGQRLVMYRADPRICDSRFLLYAMLGPDVQAELRRLGSGATVEHLRVPDCASLPIRCPNLAVQRRIGGILGALDDLIENNRRRIELLEQMAQAIYREWFVRLRYPGHERAACVEAPLDAIPADWVRTTIRDAAETLTRGIAPKYADDGSWTVLNQKCIRNGRIGLESARRQEREVPALKRVQFGDTLINSTGVGTLGRVAMYLGNHPALTADSHVTIVRPADPAANPWFAMNMVARQAEFEALGTGSTGQTELSRQDIGSLALLVPPLGLRRSFADRTWPLLMEVFQLLELNRKTSAVRDFLLPRLVTGQIDVAKLDLDELVGAVR